MKLIFLLVVGLLWLGKCADSIKFAVIGDWANLPNPENAKEMMETIKD